MGPKPGTASGFTLVELLTVIAIMAVLATLLFTALGAAQKKSRQARCTSNLHQLSLALNMYLDDFDQRATLLQPLVQTRYLPSREVLICPQDSTRNWGGLVNDGSPLFGPQMGLAQTAPALGDTRLAPASSNDAPLPFSYLHPLPWDDSAWVRLMKAGSLAGLAACQVHGLGQPGNPPSIYDFEGLVLRVQRDGAVVKRKVFWASSSPLGPPLGGPDAMAPATTSALASFDYPWRLFTDEPAP